MSMKLSLSELVATLEQEQFIITANGSSMLPTIVKGDRIHLTRGSEGRLDSDSLSVGDIVLCRDSNDCYFVHRIISLEPKIRTKGDACSVVDGEIVEVLGKVTEIQKTWMSMLRRAKLWI